MKMKKITLKLNERQILKLEKMMEYFNWKTLEAAAEGTMMVGIAQLDDAVTPKGE